MVIYKNHRSLCLLALLSGFIPLLMVPSSKQEPTKNFIQILKDAYTLWEKNNNNSAPLIDNKAAQNTLVMLHGARKTTFDASTTTNGFLHKVSSGATIFYEHKKNPEKKLPETREELFNYITDLTAFLYGCSLSWFRPVNEKNEVQKIGDKQIIFKIKSSQETPFLLSLFTTYKNASKTMKTKSWVQDISVTDGKNLTAPFCVNMHNEDSENHRRFRFLENFKKIDLAEGENKEFFIKLEKAPNNFNLNKFVTNFLPINQKVTFFSKADQGIEKVFRENFPKAPQTITSVKEMVTYVKNSTNVSAPAATTFFNYLKEFGIKNNKPAIEEQDSADELCLSEDELYVMSYFMRNPEEVAKNPTTKEINNTTLINFKVARGVFLELQTIKERVQKAFAEKLFEKTAQGFATNLTFSVIEEAPKKVLLLKQNILTFCDEAEAALPFIDDDIVYDYFKTLATGLKKLLEKYTQDLHFLFKQPLFDNEYLREFLADEAIAKINKNLSNLEKEVHNQLSEFEKKQNSNSTQTNQTPFEPLYYTTRSSFLNHLLIVGKTETSEFFKDLKQTFENKTYSENLLNSFLKEKAETKNAQTALFCYVMKELYGENNPTFLADTKIILSAFAHKNNSKLISDINKKPEHIILSLQTKIEEVLKKSSSTTGALQQMIEKICKSASSRQSQLFTKHLPKYGALNNQTTTGSQIAEKVIKDLAKKNQAYTSKEDTLIKAVSSELLIAPTLSGFKHKVYKKALEAGRETKL